MFYSIIQKTKLVPRLLAIFGAMVVVASAQTVSADIVLIGAGINNGDFNDDTSATDQRSYTDTPFWSNIGTAPDSQTFTRTNLDFNGTRNGQFDDNTANVAGAAATGASGYTIAIGDSFNVSYNWRDAFNWDDTGDQVGVTLFTTNDNLITGTATTLGSQILSGLSTANNTYELFTGTGVYTAVAADVGKNLFVSFQGVDGGGTGTSFARIDDFNLSVTTAVPEPGSFFMIGIAGLAMVFRRSR